METGLWGMILSLAGPGSPSLQHRPHRSLLSLLSVWLTLYL